jgi:hypothetical protein
VTGALAYSRSPERHTPGNRLEMLIDGDHAFPVKESYNLDAVSLFQNNELVI